jgi:hypothetical protein
MLLTLADNPVTIVCRGNDLEIQSIGKKKFNHMTEKITTCPIMIGDIMLKGNIVKIPLTCSLTVCIFLSSSGTCSLGA